MAVDPVCAQNPDKRPSGTTGSGTDRGAGAESQRLELFINKISPAIIGVDSAGLIQVVNPGATELFGYLEKELRDLNDKLSASNEALDQFVYIAAHDLKEPLRGIHNLSSIVREDCADQLDPEYREDLETVARLTVRMEHLIDDPREYSRIERREREGEKITATKAVEIVLDDLNGFLTEQSANITVEGMLSTQAFPSAHLTSIFRNLITNGIKYNDKPEKSLEISGRVDRKFVIFSVADNGIGIEPEFQNKVFDMFRRFHGEDTYGGGTGAGLAIVKRILDHSGGWINFETEVGKGTAFSFGLPIQAEASNGG